LSKRLDPTMMCLFRGARTTTRTSLLASIVAEPYSRVAVTMAMTCLVWFRVVIYVRKKDIVGNRQ
jgi:hypothetical protein